MTSLACRSRSGSPEPAQCRSVFGSAAQLHYTASMKTSAIPSVRVEPELREELERNLRDGETVSQFVEASVREGVRRRLNDAEFVARGLRSLDEARVTGDYVDADTVVGKLERQLAQARKRKTAVRR